MDEIEKVSALHNPFRRCGSQIFPLCNIDGDRESCLEFGQSVKSIAVLTVQVEKVGYAAAWLVLYDHSALFDDCIETYLRRLAVTLRGLHVADRDDSCGFVI